VNALGNLTRWPRHFLGRPRQSPSSHDEVRALSTVLTASKPARALHRGLPPLTSDCTHCVLIPNTPRSRLWRGKEESVGEILEIFPDGRKFLALLRGCLFLVRRSWGVRA